MTETAHKNYNWIIYTASILIPLVVFGLYFMPKPKNADSLSFLPTLNAIINGTTAILLIAAFAAIRKKQILLHRNLMIVCIVLSVCFLVSYLLYHFTHASTPFGGTGLSKIVYYIVLLTHILLSIAVVPLVLITFVRALSKRFDKHKKIARITLPIWLYVTISGVVVYIMIAPYYN